MPDSVHVHVFRGNREYDFHYDPTIFWIQLWDLSLIEIAGGDIECLETVWEQMEGRGNETIPRVKF